MKHETPGQVVEGKRELARKLDAAGWGLFFIWIGAAALTSVGWGVTLVGVGIITVGGQLARKSLGLPVEGFWLFVGGLFFVSGLWTAFGLGKATTPWTLIPVVCIVAGATLLFSALLRRADRTGR